MPLNIKHPEADHLARELAAATGESITEAVTKALRDRLERHQRSARAFRPRDLLREARQRLSRLPVLDARPADEILGYDERGLPR